MNRTPIVFALLVWVALACWPTSVALGHLWSQVDNSHGFLIAALSAWLVFRSRQEIERAPTKPSLLAFAGLLVFGLAWIVAWRAGLQALHLVLMPVLMGLAVYATFGFAVALRVAFPLAMLYFALPVWDIFTAPLQALTVRITDALLQVAHIPASIEGNHVHLAVGTFEIAAGCSGLHFFIVGLALAALVGELDRQSIVKRSVLIVIMALLAMISNWIRVFVIVLAGNYTDMKHYLVHNHYGFGWAVFAVCVVLFLWLVRRFFPAPKSAGDEAVAADVSRQGLPIVSALCAALLVAITLVGNLIPSLRERGETPRIGVKLPSGVASWRGPEVSGATTWWPEFKGAPARAQGVYVDASGNKLEAFVVVYRVQRQDAELIGFGNSLTGAYMEATDSRAVDTPAGRFIETSVFDSNGDQGLVWQTYDIGGRRFVEPLESQLWYGVTSILREQTASLFAYRALCDTNCDAARKSLESFASSMTTPLMASIQTPAPYSEATASRVAQQPTPEARFQAAMKYMSERNYARAELAFMAANRFDAAKLTPQQQALLTAGLVEARLAQKKVAEAKDAQRLLMQTFPAAAGTRLLGARVKLAEKDGEGAASDLQTIVTDYPDYLPARILLGQLLITQRKLYQAEAQLKATVAKFPQDKVSRTLLLETQLRLAKPEDIGNPALLNNMAWRYMQEGDDRAETFARRAYDLAPQNPAVADTYGWVIFKMKKDATRALPLLTAAAEGAPDDRQVQFHYASVLIAAGEAVRGRALLEKTLAGSTAFPERKDAEGLLQTVAANTR